MLGNIFWVRTGQGVVLASSGEVRGVSDPADAGQCPHPTCSKGLCGPNVNSAKVEKPCLIPRWLLKRCLLNEYIMENAVKYWVFTICHILN